MFSVHNPALQRGARGLPTYRGARGEVHRGLEAAVEGREGVDQVVLPHPPRSPVALAGELVDRALDVAGAQVEEGALFELLFVIGGYLCLSVVLNSIGLRGGAPAGP